MSVMPGVPHQMAALQCSSKYVDVMAPAVGELDVLLKWYLPDLIK